MTCAPSLAAIRPAPSPPPASPAAGRRPPPTSSRAREGEIVLLALPDDRLAEAAALLRHRGYLAPGAVLVHFSGLHRATILLGEEEPERPALSLHPLQSFADPAIGVRALQGSPFAVEGTEAALPLGERLVTDMGGVPFRINGEQKVLYHAAACLAANYLVALVAAAGDLLTASGFEREKSYRLLTPLLRTTVNNLAALGPEGALTGPIARGDVNTVKNHLQALAAQPPELAEIYRVLGRKTVEVAERQGNLPEERAKELLEVLGKT